MYTFRGSNSAIFIFVSILENGTQWALSRKSAGITVAVGDYSISERWRGVHLIKPLNCTYSQDAEIEKGPIFRL